MKCDPAVKSKETRSDAKIRHTFNLYFSLLAIYTTNDCLSAFLERVITIRVITIKVITIKVITIRVITISLFFLTDALLV